MLYRKSTLDLSISDSGWVSKMEKSLLFNAAIVKLDSIDASPIANLIDDLCFGLYKSLVSIQGLSIECNDRKGGNLSSL